MKIKNRKDAVLDINADIFLECAFPNLAPISQKRKASNASVKLVLKLKCPGKVELIYSREIEMSRK
jgi:hypothetical protein